MDGVNIFNCRNKGLTSLPDTVLKDTDWLLLSGNNLGSLNKAPDYLENITLVNLSSSNIKDVDTKVMEAMIKSVKHLDIRGNKLIEIPQIIAEAKNTTQLWISDNPYQCNCDMIWMKDWLINTHSVQDKEIVTCLTGKTNGKIIHKILKQFLHL